MFMVSGAKLCQFSRYAWAIGHEPSWLEHWSKLTVDPANPGRHTALAHMGLDSLNVIVRHQLLDNIQSPAGRQPWVLMKKEPPMFPLVLIDLGTESDIALGLLHPELELLHPHVVIPIHIFVQLLES